MLTAILTVKLIILNLKDNNNDNNNNSLKHFLCNIVLQMVFCIHESLI